MKAKNICLIFSLVLVLAGSFLFIQKGDSAYGIDFKGGQSLEYQIKPAVGIEDVRSYLGSQGFEDISIQEFTDIEGGIIVNSKNDISTEVLESLSKKYDDVQELRVDTIGPAVGKVLRQKAGWAILFSLVGILIYVAIRFKHFEFALAAVIALLHDVILSLGVFCFAGYEVSLLTVTALLTIAGYSINDTIVIYDRIRELSPRMKKTSLKDIVNVAINSTLSRTIITSLTTLLVVVSIFILGGEALNGFAFALIVGIIAGTYSSIYIAAPLVFFFRKARV